MNTIYPTYWYHVACVDAVAQHGIAPPPAWTALRGRFSALECLETPMREQLVAAIVNGATPADIAVLRAAAFAEEAADSQHQAAVVNGVRGTVHSHLVEIYRTVAAKNYKTIASEFDTAAATFTKSAKIVDPESPSDAIVTLGDKERGAWLSAAAAAGRLDELIEPLAAAAELAGAPIGIGPGNTHPDADTLRLPLVCDPGDAHRRRTWESWASTGTCGRWSALHALGVTIRSHPRPSELDAYRPPRPLQTEWVPGPRGGHERRTVDPEDGASGGSTTPDQYAAVWS